MVFVTFHIFVDIMNPFFVDFWIFCGYFYVDIFCGYCFFSIFFLFSLGYVELGLEVGESALSLFFSARGRPVAGLLSLSILNHQTIQLNKLGPPRVFYRTLKISSL